jgi:hypothetical protein
MKPEEQKQGWSVNESAEWLITLALLALMVMAFMATSRWPRNAAMFPAIVTGLAASLLALKLVLMFVRRLLAGPVLERITGRPRRKQLPSDLEMANPPDTSVFATTPVGTWIETLVWLVIFFALLVVGGILPTLVVFSIGYLLIVARKSVWFAVAYAAVLVGSVHLLFVQLLSLRLPQGMLGF